MIQEKSIETYLKCTNEVHYVSLKVSGYKQKLDTKVLPMIFIPC